MERNCRARGKITRRTADLSAKEGECNNTWRELCGSRIEGAGRKLHGQGPKLKEHCGWN